jgi:hypothetical protein
MTYYITAPAILYSALHPLFACRALEQEEAAVEEHSQVPPYPTALLQHNVTCYTAAPITLQQLFVSLFACRALEQAEAAEDAHSQVPPDPTAQI